MTNEIPLITENGYIFLIENIIDQHENAGCELNDSNVIELLAYQLGVEDDRARDYLRHLLTQSCHSGRWPEAEIEEISQ